MLQSSLNAPPFHSKKNLLASGPRKQHSAWGSQETGGTSPETSGSLAWRRPWTASRRHPSLGADLWITGPALSYTHVHKHTYPPLLVFIGREGERQSWETPLLCTHTYTPPSKDCKKQGEGAGGGGGGGGDEGGLNVPV